VGLRLMADVPVASLLSGGVDSTLVTQMMARHLPYAPHTYGIGFPSAGHLNEALAARRAAETLGVPHHSILVDDEDFHRDLDGEDAPQHFAYPALLVVHRYHDRQLEPGRDRV